MCYCEIVTKLANFNLTKSDIQKVKGFENITDKQADKISEFLALYSIIIFDKMNGKYES